MPSNQLKNQHLMWRAGFGPAAAQIQQLKDLHPAELFSALQEASAKKPQDIIVADNYIKGLFLGAGEVGRQQRRKDLDENEKKRQRQKQREYLQNLNLQWLHQMIDSESQLREKVAFFWHGHFASRNLNVFFQQELLGIIRRHALGSFRTLLHEVSTSAAILNFLNAAQNRKDRPNENFAREVMELFTLGRGAYTENDVKEAARAFTGWTVSPAGDFEFRKGMHDTGSKTILGYTGNFGGEDVLDLLLEQKATAHFITRKIYRFFVNEKENEKIISALAERFYKNDYNIAGLMQDIFTSEWFYSEQNIGAKIKSPIELITGIQRMLPMKLEDEESLLLIQKLLGQILFYPPNVAGWPGGITWIDSSTLMMRLRIPQLISDRDQWNLQPKTDDDVSGGRSSSEVTNWQVRKPIKATISWDHFTSQFQSIERPSLLPAMQQSILQVPLQFNVSLLTNYTDNSSRATYIKTATLQLMSTPEYQMC